MIFSKYLLPVFLSLFCICPATGRCDDPPLIALAVLDFEHADRQQPELGKNAADLLSVELMSEPGFILVERSRMNDTLSEHEINLSGLVDSSSAVKLGKLTGAQVLVSGRIFDMGEQRYVVVRTVSTRTGRIFADKAVLKPDEDLSDAIEALAAKVTKRLEDHTVALLGDGGSKEQRIEKLQGWTKEKVLPTVSVRIPEVHMGAAIPDPAAETEILWVLTQLGFKVLEPGTGKPDITITGEAFSERGLVKGNLVSCLARLEVKAVNRKGEVVFVDRESTVAVDLATNIAAKSALQKAGLEMSYKLVPALVEQK